MGLAAGCGAGAPEGVVAAGTDSFTDGRSCADAVAENRSADDATAMEVEKEERESLGSERGKNIL